jgi:hypothetical protein
LKCIRRASIDSFLYEEDYLSLPTTDPESIAFFPDIGLDITTDKDVALNVRPTFQSISKDGVKVYLLLKPEGGLFALYREKDISDPIGYLAEDKKTLYNKDKQKVRKLSDL